MEEINIIFKDALLNKLLSTVNDCSCDVKDLLFIYSSSLKLIFENLNLKERLNKEHIKSLNIESCKNLTFDILLKKINIFIRGDVSELIDTLNSLQLILRKISKNVEISILISPLLFSILLYGLYFCKGILQCFISMLMLLHTLLKIISQFRDICYLASIFRILCVLVSS